MAGSNTLCSTVLKLSADTGALNKDLAGAEGKIKAWGKKQEKTGKDAGKDTGKGMNEALKEAGKEGGKGGKKGWGASILSGIGVVGGAFVGVVGAAVGAAIAIGSAWMGVAEGMLKTKKAASELGVGLLGFSALESAAKVAGVATEDLQEGILALEKNLALADEPAARLFGELGLSAEKLRAMPIDESMATIADALNGLNDPAKAARLSLEIFGDKALALQPLLKKGGDGIRQLAAEAKASGEAFDEVAADKLTAAQEAINKLSGLWSGFCNTLAIATSAVIEWGASALSCVGSVLSSVGSWFYSLGETIGGWGEAAYDAIIEAAGTVWEEVEPYWDAFVDYAGQAWDWLSETACDVWNDVYTASVDALEGMGVDTGAWAKTIREWVDTVKGWFSALWDYVRSFWDWIFSKKGKDALADTAAQITDDKAGGSSGGDWGSKGETAGNLFADGMKKGLTKVNMEVLKSMNDLEKDLRKSMATVGMTGAEGKIWDMEQKGAGGAQLDKLKGLAQAAKEVEAAWSTVQVTPLEMWQRQLSGLDTMLESGRITWDQYARGVANAGKQMMSAAGGMELKTVGAAFKDSSASMSAQIKAELQDRVQNDPAAEMRRAQMELKEIQKKQLAVAEKMLAAMQKDNEDEWEQF